MNAPIPALETQEVAVLADHADVRNTVLATIAVLLAISIAYHDSFITMAGIWLRSDTFAHGILIFPISAWLIWSRRGQLAASSPQPNPLALPLLAGLGFSWLLARLAGVQVLELYCAVSMIPVVVWGMLGNRMTAIIVFPLAYLLLAVPFGDVLIPPLIDFTAHFTVAALQFTGIPVYREGNFFSIPSGNWSVVEACSGLRYLIASFTLGTVYAYLNYRSFGRRLAFVALSAVVPVIANGVRAYMIVMIGHLSSMRFAVGMDHLIYGWIFFGLVMLLLAWVGTFWREPEVTPLLSRQSPMVHMRGQSEGHRSIALGATGCFIAAAIWPAYAAFLDSRAVRAAPESLRIESASGRWQELTGVTPGWAPRYVGTPALSMKAYRASDKPVFIFTAHYRNQVDGSELVNSGNVLVHESDRDWRDLNRQRRSVPFGGQEHVITQDELHSPGKKLLVWRWYWLGEQVTVNPYLATAILAWKKVAGFHDDMAEVMLVTEYEENVDRAAALLQSFLNDMLGAVNKGLHDAAQH